MKERPILFSGDMVRAILAGTKTQTRRVIKPQPHDNWENERPCPYGVPGDRLWVRETWRDDSFDWEWGTQTKYSYRADYADGKGGGAWRPSIHMPRGASRILLEITGVRAERLQIITESDMQAEGIVPVMVDSGGMTPWGDGIDVPRYDWPFIDLWDNLNAKRGYGWDVNPWVWVIEFKPLALGAGKRRAG